MLTPSPQSSHHHSFPLAPVNRCESACQQEVSAFLRSRGRFRRSAYAQGQDLLRSSSRNCRGPACCSSCMYVDFLGSCFRMHFRSLEEFWPFYMNQHTKASTRRWHFCATLAATVFLVAALLIKWWLFFFAPLFGYGLSWYSHFFIEGNSPAAFGHPIWSFMCDCKMFGLMLTGRMDREIKRLGKRPIIQVS